MQDLFTLIKAAVLEDRYLIGIHAANQLDERGIPDWQVVESLPQGKLICERPHDMPNAVIEVEQVLPDGTPVKAVWSWLTYNRVAKLVTVHYFNR